jgi:hypothetical protein
MKNCLFVAVTVISVLAVSTVASKAGYDVPTAGLIGYWPANGTAADVSPVHNNGSFGGSFVAGSPTGGSAFNLTSKVVIPHNSLYNFTGYAGWSVGFWFNGNGAVIDANNGLFLGQDNGPGYNPKWLINYGYTVFGNDSRFHFHVNDQNQERIFVGSDPVPAPEGWNQLTVTIDNSNSGTVAFYLNGQAIGTAAMGNYVLRTTAPLIFGQAEGFSFGGLISDVVIYNRVLLTNEVQQLAAISVNRPFSITNQYLDGSGNIVIIWESTPGRTYHVVSSASLASTAVWTKVGRPVLATNTNASASIPITSCLEFFAVVTP